MRGRLHCSRAPRGEGQDGAILGGSSARQARRPRRPPAGLRRRETPALRALFPPARPGPAARTKWRRAFVCRRARRLRPPRLGGSPEEGLTDSGGERERGSRALLLLRRRLDPARARTPLVLPGQNGGRRLPRPHLYRFGPAPRDAAALQSRRALRVTDGSVEPAQPGPSPHPGLHHPPAPAPRAWRGGHLAGQEQEQELPQCCHEGQRHCIQKLGTGLLDPSKQGN